MEEGEQRMKDGGRRRKGDERISERRGMSEMWNNEGKRKKTACSNKTENSNEHAAI